MTVIKAIRVGELLTEQKEYMGHGNFLPWLEQNLDISERTARNYMGLYRYKDKTAKVADLQTAYQQIETLGKQAKQSKEENDRRLIAEYRKIGVKPEGWTWSLDNCIKQEDEAIAKQTERMEKLKKERGEWIRLYCPAKLQDLIDSWFEDNGLSESSLKNKLVELINVKEPKFFTSQGRIIEERVVPDNTTR